MEKKRGFKKWIIIGILLVIGGGAFIFFNPKKGLKLVLPDLDNISLVKANIKNDTAYLGINLLLENKSIFKLTLDTLFYKITLADSLLFKETKALHIRQKPGERSSVEMPLRIPIPKTMGTIRSLQDQDSTYVDIESYIVYNTLLGSQKISISKKIKIGVPVPPQLKLEDIEMDKLSLSDKTVEIIAKVKIINEGKILDLNIHKIHYALMFGDKLFSSDGTYDKSIMLKPVSETEVEIPITIKVNKIVKTVWKYITNEKLKYHIVVTAELDENNFYRKNNIPLEVRASGIAKLRKKK